VIGAKLQRGEVIAKENSRGILVMKWKDKGDVTLLSTKHGYDIIETGKHNRKNEAVKNPVAVVYYNKIKQGVDISDHMSSYHSPVRTSVRWFHKVAVEFPMGTAVMNAMISFNQHCRNIGKCSDQLKIAQFREHLVMYLLKTESDASGNSQLNSTSSGSGPVHYLQVIIYTCFNTYIL